VAGPDPIETAFRSLVDSECPSVAAVLDFEPMIVPEVTPAVTMLFAPRLEQRRHQTGPAAEVWWAWDVFVYCGLVDGPDHYLEAQSELKIVLPELFAVVRRFGTLNDTCDFAELEDAGRPPTPDHDRVLLVKTLRLRALTEEI
jgi:hypothetical protein